MWKRLLEKILYTGPNPLIRDIVPMSDNIDDLIVEPSSNDVQIAMQENVLYAHTSHCVGIKVRNVSPRVVDIAYNLRPLERINNIALDRDSQLILRYLDCFTYNTPLIPSLCPFQEIFSADCMRCDGVIFSSAEIIRTMFRGKNPAYTFKFRPGPIPEGGCEDELKVAEERIRNNGMLTFLQYDRQINLKYEDCLPFPVQSFQYMGGVLLARHNFY